MVWFVGAKDFRTAYTGRFLLQTHYTTGSTRSRRLRDPGAPHELVRRYSADMETETRCHWHYTHPAWGRVMTKEPFNEFDARQLLPDAERVEGTEVVVPAPSKVGHGFDGKPGCS